MKPKQYILVANWKMNPATYGEASKLWRNTAKKADEAKKVVTIMCPPYVFTGRMPKITSKRVYKGAQDVFYEDRGSFTGNISMNMLMDAEVTHVIVGHSERRKQGDTNEIVNKKLHAVLKRDLIPIVCIGEETRNDNGEHLTFLRNQIAETFKGITKKNAGKIIIAYEPIWAIGGTAAMTPHDVHETTLFIKKIIMELFKGLSRDSFPILYGGSVDPENARALVDQGAVDGLLVGRQSLESEAFNTIITRLNA